MEQKELRDLLLSTSLFEYKSYDHKQAMEEYKNNPDYKAAYREIPNPPSWYMPEKLKEKYSFWQKGKLREIHYAPNGNIWRVKIGNKYCKSFYLTDFGVNVKPFQP